MEKQTTVKFDVKTMYSAEKMAVLPKDKKKEADSKLEILQKSYDTWETTKNEQTIKPYKLFIRDSEVQEKIQYLIKFVEKKIKATGRENKGVVNLLTSVYEARQSFHQNNSDFEMKSLDIQALYYFAEKYESNNSTDSQHFVFNLLDPLYQILSEINKDVESIKELEKSYNDLQVELLGLIEGVDVEGSENSIKN